MGIQMPPIATSVVDEDDVALVEAWIAQMPGPDFPAGGDGGAAPDGGVDDSDAATSAVDDAASATGDEAQVDPADDAGI
jgi:hypothetical protein